MSACSRQAVSHRGWRLMVASSAKMRRPRRPASVAGRQQLARRSRGLSGVALLLCLPPFNRANSVPMAIRVVRTVSALRRAVIRWRGRGERIALVPTMGALHEGHLALVRAGRRRARRLIVSIFVNPAQFAPHEDLASYPRSLKADLDALADMKVDLAWAPTAALMYPRGFATRIVPQGPATAGLEDKFRPHFFSGVATVVAKLLIQC